MPKRKPKEELDLDLDFDAVQESVEDVEFKEPTKMSDVLPKYGSSEWQDYVLSLFKEYELDQGCPKCAALRRVGQMLGRVLYSGPVQVFCSTDGNNLPRSTVVYKIEIDWNLDRDIEIRDFDYVEDRRVFTAVSDSDHMNTNGEFAVHTAAMAETRAEARCWRKALALDIVSSEEMQTPKDAADIVSKYKKTASIEIEESERLSDSQKLGINTLSKRLGIDVVKLINYGYDEVKYKSIEVLERGTASKIMDRLNDYQQGKEVPKEIKL